MIIAPLPRNAPAGLYIHIPFCSHICPYCDFTTYAGKGDLIPRYVDAVVRDIERSTVGLNNRSVGSIFVGGGTPSLLGPGHIARILGACHAHANVTGDAEVTMEANPNGLDASRLEGFLRAGVNRLSIGAQTLDRRGLRTLGRQHEASDVLLALSVARRSGFERISLDLIFGWPGQTLDTWRRDLSTVLDTGTGPDHLSLYSLIVEPGTPFADAAARGILHMPDDDATADLYEAAISTLAEAGWHHYEIANWGDAPANVSRHNALYWQHGDYLGIGAGAHGHVDGVRTINHLLPETYIHSIEHGGDSEANREVIDETTSRFETVMMGFRLVNAGITYEAFEERHDVDFHALYEDQLGTLVDLDLVRIDQTHAWLSPRGLMLANEVLSRFI